MKDIKLVDKINARVPKAPGGDTMHYLSKSEFEKVWEHVVDMVNYGHHCREAAEYGKIGHAKEHETKYMEARDNVVELLFGEGMRVVNGKEHDQLRSDLTALQAIEDILGKRIQELEEEVYAYANQIMELTGFGDSEGLGEAMAATGLDIDF